MQFLQWVLYNCHTGTLQILKQSMCEHNENKDWVEICWPISSEEICEVNLKEVKHWIRINEMIQYWTKSENKTNYVYLLNLYLGTHVENCGDVRKGDNRVKNGLVLHEYALNIKGEWLEQKKVH